MSIPFLNRITAVAAAAVLALPSPAGAQSVSVEIQRIADAAHDAGLPTESIINRARLGLQVGSAPALIVSAARSERDKLAEARSVLGVDAPEPDLVAGADALRNDVHRASLKRIRDARPSGSVAVAIGVLTQLVADGAREKTATDAVTQLMRHVGDTQLLAWGKQVREDVRSMRINADQALQLQLRAVVGAYPAPPSGGSAAEALSLDPRLTTGGAVPPKIIKRPPDK